MIFDDEDDAIAERWPDIACFSSRYTLERSRLMNIDDRQRDNERGAAPFSCARRPDAAAMQFHDVPDDRQAQAQPAMCSRHR